MPIPSQAKAKAAEGVETGWAAPKGPCHNGGSYGEGTVQTTNALRLGRRRKPKWDESWGRGFESRRGHHGLLMAAGTRSAEAAQLVLALAVALDSLWTLAAAWACGALPVQDRLRDRRSGGVRVGAGLGLALARPK